MVILALGLRTARAISTHADRCLSVAWRAPSRRLPLSGIGPAQPHSFGSLGFPLTASIVIGATATIAYIVGIAFGVVWNWLAGATKLTRAIWIVVLLVSTHGHKFTVVGLTRDEVTSSGG